MKQSKKVIYQQETVLEMLEEEEEEEELWSGRRRRRESLWGTNLLIRRPSTSSITSMAFLLVLPFNSNRLI